MYIPLWLETAFLRAVDKVYRCIPQPKPLRQRFEQARVIAHRGVHHATQAENTFAALDAAVALGVWGIELDIRWTKDLVPVVNHDVDCLRVFKQAVSIAEINFVDLRRQLAFIPSLEEVIQRYGKKIHLMVELKEEVYPNPQKQNLILKQLFADLVPRKDYSFISLSPAMFEYVTFPPTEVFFPIAAIQTKSLADLVLKKKYGGLLGHYFFVKDPLIRRLVSQHKQVGLGFISSKNSLYRELNRGISWLYTNEPELLQNLINTELGHHIKRES